MVEAAAAPEPGARVRRRARSRTTSRPSRSTLTICLRVVLPRRGPGRLLPARRAATRARSSSSTSGRWSSRSTECWTRPSRRGLLADRAAPVLPAAAHGAAGRRAPAALGARAHRAACGLALTKRVGCVFCSAGRLTRGRASGSPGGGWSRSPGSTGRSRSVSPRRSSILRVLGPSGAGRFTIVIATVDFLALLVWLTSDDALVKYGFRYAANEEWGRFQRLDPGRVRLRARRVPRRHRADRRDRPVRRLDLRARRRARGAAPDRRAAAAAPGARVDRRGDADPRRAATTCAAPGSRSRWAFGSPGSSSARRSA